MFVDGRKESGVGSRGRIRQQQWREGEVHITGRRGCNNRWSADGCGGGVFRGGGEMVVGGLVAGVVEAVLPGALPGPCSQEVSEEQVWLPWEAWLPLV